MDNSEEDMGACGDSSGASPSETPPPVSAENEEESGDSDSEAAPEADVVEKRLGTTMIWTAEQFSIHKTKHPWLVRKENNFGCAVCGQVGKKGAGVGDVTLAKQWVTGTVNSTAPDMKKRERAMRKKIVEHEGTIAHKAACEIVKKAKDNTLEQVVVNAQAQQISTTANVFRGAYKEAKRNRPAYGFEHEIDCQQLNGVKMGRILHSNVACSNIQEHISSEMKKKTFACITQSEPKICLMLDEATGLNKHPALIVYVRFQLETMENAANVYVDLVQLEDCSAGGIVQSLLSALEKVHFNEEFLAKCLVGVT